MHNLRKFKELSRTAVAALMIAAVPMAGFAQNAPATPPPDAPQANTSAPRTIIRHDYSREKRHFPNPIAPYMAQSVPEPAFTNTPRIDSLIRDSQLMLSLDDAIALALENNLDLAIARYNLAIADTDVLRSKSGSSIRGVATGLVQGTPGGGQGGFGTGASGAGAGGTSSGAGGAGSGSSGLVQSTLGAGGPIPQYDPSIGGTIEIEQSVTPLSSTRITGVPVLNQHTTLANFAYNQGFATGTSLSVGLNNNRQSNNNLFNALNPTLNSNFRATISQHLLQGFGLDNNLRFIRIAKNNRRISDSAFRNQVVSTVSQIQNIYWDLVNAYEDVKVKERSLGLAQRTRSDNQKQVEIGTLAPIEIVRADAESATRNQDLIISRTNLQLQQTLMKNAISRNLDDPRLAAIPVVPTDIMNVPSDEVSPSVEELVKQALDSRPEIEQTRIDLVNRGISKHAARNALLPTVDVFGFYGGTGLGGVQNSALTCGTTATTGCIPPNSFPSGFGSAFGNLFDSSAPDKGAGVSLSIPLRNRAAQADQVRSELEYRQAQLRLQQLQNTIGIEVRNAQFALAQNRARVQAATEGRRLAEQSLNAEQKKYQLGASTNFNVLQAQRDVSQSESNVVVAMSAYEKSRVELDRVTGNTLARLNIKLPDAQVGVVNEMPSVPGIELRKDTTPTQQQKQQMQQLPQQQQPPTTQPQPEPTTPK